MFEWHFDQTFRLVITREAHGARVMLIGDLDAVTAKNLEQRARLPVLTGTDVIIDLSELEAIDTAGARQVHRIASLYEECELEGARPPVRELLDMMPRSLT
jgi:anti-anti-sigma regulatory factor